MAAMILLLVLLATALLAPWFGVDSRGLTDRSGGPPDILPGPGPGADLEAGLGAGDSGPRRRVTGRREPHRHHLSGRLF
jgi:hypothetical protein